MTAARIFHGRGWIMFLQFFIVIEINLLYRTTLHCSSLNNCWFSLLVKNFPFCFVNDEKKGSQVMHLWSILICLNFLSSIIDTHSLTWGYLATQNWRNSKYLGGFWEKHMKFLFNYLDFKKNKHTTTLFWISFRFHESFWTIRQAKFLQN